MEQPDDVIIEQFLDVLWLERNLAENTLASYRFDLQALAAWRLWRQQRDCLSASAVDLQAFLADRLDNCYKATIAARLLSVTEWFFSICTGKAAQQRSQRWYFGAQIAAALA